MRRRPPIETNLSSADDNGSLAGLFDRAYQLACRLEVIGSGRGYRHGPGIAGSITCCVVARPMITLQDQR